MTRPAPSSPMREGQTFGGASRLVRYINFVKLPHTVFALAPGELVAHARGSVVDVREQTAGVP